MLSSLISFAVTALFLVLSLAFRAARKLRLTLPLLYFLVAVVSTFFTDWTSDNEPLVLLGLYILLGLVALSWVFTLVKKIRNKAASAQLEKYFERFAMLQVEQARAKGILPERVCFDTGGYLLNVETGKPVF